MNSAPARGFQIGTALLVLALGAAVALAAEFHGARLEIWCGAGGGALIVLLGHLFNRRATAAPRTSPFDRNEEERRWRAWGLGLLARFVLLAALAGTLWLTFRAQFPAAMLSLLSVYLSLHFWEIVWLCRQAAAAERAGARG